MTLCLTRVLRFISSPRQSLARSPGRARRGRALRDQPVYAYTVWQSFGGQMIGIVLMLAMTYLVMRHRPSLRTKIQFQYLPASSFVFRTAVTYHFMIAIICVLLGFYITMIAISERS